MNHYARAIEIIVKLPRTLSEQEMKIAMDHPAIFIKAFNVSARYNVILTDHGPRKIGCIKELRAITSLGLKEAKEMSEACPVPVVKNVDVQVAEKISQQLRSVGASTIIEKQE